MSFTCEFELFEPLNKKKQKNYFLLSTIHRQLKVRMAVDLPYLIVFLLYVLQIDALLSIATGGYGDQAYSSDSKKLGILTQDAVSLFNYKPPWQVVIILGKKYVLHHTKIASALSKPYSTSC